MHSSHRSILSILTAVLSLTVNVPAAEFYPISSVETNTVNFYLEDNLIQGPGVGFSEEEPYDALGGGADFAWVTDAPGGFPSDYIEAAGEPVVILDLGKDVPLNEISVWGYSSDNANGIREFSLRFATSEEGADGLGNSITYNPAFEAGLDSVPRQSLPFDQIVTARFVELTGISTFFNEDGDPPGGDRAGLGEVAFEVPPVTGEPNIDVEPEIALDLSADEITVFNVPVNNTGDQNLTVSATEVTGANAAAFKVNTVSSPIAGLTTGNIVMQFDPVGLGGAISATLKIISDDPDSPEIEIVLAGALPDLGPDVVVDAEIVLALQNQVETFDIPVGNAGAQDLVISGTELTGVNASAFSVTSFPPTIPAGTTQNIQIQFSPGSIRGNVSATLRISSNDADAPVAEVDLIGGLPAEFYSIDSVVTSTEDTDLFPGDNLIQGVDLGYDSAWPHDALGGGQDFTWVTDAPGGFPADYIDVAGEPTIVIDLGEDVPLSEISVWGYATTNANGVSRFSLKFATGNDGLEEFGASISYNPAFEPIIDSTPRQSFLFEETVFARYVEMTCEATFYSNGGNGPPPGGDRVGLGEIAFEIRPVSGGTGFQIISLELVEAGALVTFTSRNGATYAVERSTDLQEWEELDDGLDSEGESTQFLDDQLPGDWPEAFYRAREL